MCEIPKKLGSAIHAIDSIHACELNVVDDPG